jgi:hypothetical protein
VTPVLLHVSIPADEPERVARAIADIAQGTVLLFPPVPGAFMVWCGTDQRTIVEVNPRGHEHVPANGQFGIRTNPSPSPYSEAHIAIGTALPAEGVLSVGRREGWLAQHSDRGGLFSVIELWLENKFLLEVLIEAEQRRYSDNVTVDRFRAVFALDAVGGNAA